MIVIAYDTYIGKSNVKFMYTITGSKELLFRNTTKETSTQYSMVTNKIKMFREI